MAKDREKLILEIMADAEKENDPLTREEAEHIADLELNYKIDVGARAESIKKDRKPKEIKVSAEKIELFDLIWEGLHNYYDENAEIIKNNKLISVKIGEKTFKIDIIEQRKVKTTKN